MKLVYDENRGLGLRKCAKKGDKRRWFHLSFPAEWAGYIIIPVMVLRVFPRFLLHINFFLGIFSLFATAITPPHEWVVFLKSSCHVGNDNNISHIDPTVVLHTRQQQAQLRQNRSGTVTGQGG